MEFDSIFVGGCGQPAALLPLLRVRVRVNIILTACLERAGSRGIRSA